MAVHRRKNLKYETVNVPDQVGITVTEMKQHTITADIAANDVIEIGALPAACVLTDFKVVRSDTNPSSNLHFGILDGDYLSDVATRDIATADQVITNNPETALTPTASVSAIYAQRSRANEYDDRGIGCKAVSAMTGANGGTITILYSYMPIGGNI